MTIKCGVFPTDLDKSQAERMLWMAVHLDSLPVPAGLQPGLEFDGDNKYWIHVTPNIYRRECYALWKRMTPRAKLVFYIGMVSGGIEYSREAIEAMLRGMTADATVPDARQLTDPLLKAAHAQLEGALSSLCDVIDHLGDLKHLLVEQTTATLKANMTPKPE